MLDQIFDINAFNIIQDNDYYYFFRALNMSDNKDIEEGITYTNNEILRIRTDLERYEGAPKYKEDDEISLEQMVDHIKMHQRKDTNCISLTSNANTAITYGRGNYKDRYVLIKVPKSELDNKVYQAGLYMLKEINKKIESLISNGLVPDYDIKKFYLERIDSATSQEELDYIKSLLPKELISDEESNDEDFINGLEQILTTSKNFISLNKEQNFIKNKIIMKLDIIGTQILPRISNKFLIQTLGSAFSSLELIHYREIPKDKIIDIPKELVDILGLLQQLPKDTPYLEEAISSIISRVDKIKVNGEFKYSDYSIQSKYLTLDKMYELTLGRVDYKTASLLYKNAFYIAKSKLRCMNSIWLLKEILHNDSKYEGLFNTISSNCFGIEPSITTRASSDLLKVSESVSLNISPDEKDLVDYIRGLNESELHSIMNNPESTLKELLSRFIDNKYEDTLDKEEWYANSIIDLLDLTRFRVKEKLSTSQRNDIIDALKKHDFMSKYYMLKSRGVLESDIANALFTCLIKDTDRVDPKATFTLEELEHFIGYNILKGTKLQLKSYQRIALNRLDKIFKTKQFASIIMPTGSGKSYVALAEMYKHKDESILYLAPNVEILHQIKRLIRKTYSPMEHLGDVDDDIIKRVFPNLTITTYQALSEESGKDIINNKYDLIVFDELHRTGASTWKSSVESLLDNQSKKTKILGITATPERDVDLKDMADHWAQKYGYTDDEIIEEKHIAYNMDIKTAIELGIIANPRVINCEYTLLSSGYLDEMGKMIKVIPDKDKKKEISKKYKKIRKQVENSKGIEQILFENLSGDSKFIVFLPISKKNDGTYEDVDGNIVSKSSADRIIKDYQALIKQYIFSYKYLNNNPKIKEIYNKIINNIEVTKEEIEYLYSEKDNILLLDKINIVGKSPALNTETNIIGNTLIEYLMLERLSKEELSKRLTIKTKDDIDVYSMLGTYSDTKNQKALASFSSKNNNKPKLMFVMNKLNEGVHAPGVNGIIWLRPLDSNSRILFLQQLGRCITTDTNEQPLIIDLVNNTLNVDLEKGITQEEIDLNKLRIISNWIKTNNRYPLINSDDNLEYKLAKSLKYIFDKYIKYIEDESLLQSENTKNKLIIKEIINEGFNIDLWNYEFGELLISEPKKGKKGQDRADSLSDIFEISSIAKDFIELKEDMENNIISWNTYYDLAKNYYNYYGNLEIPRSFKTIDGINEDPNGLSLGICISTQRLAYKGKVRNNLTKEKIELLNQIGMIWDVYQDAWEKFYSLAKKYYEYYGNLIIPKSFKTIDGINEDPNGVSLGMWIRVQRRAYKGTSNNTISKERIELLNQIGMIWELKKDTWRKNYELAKKYYEHYGKLVFPTDFKTLDGIHEDPNGIALSTWIHNQRGRYKGHGGNRLSQEQIELLNQIGMTWDYNNDTWNKYYELAKNYYEHNGNLNVPIDFKTLDGITEDSNGIALGIWISIQRRAYKGVGQNIITKERIELLNQIGMVWDYKNTVWERNYELAKKYYEYYGNLDIPSDFKTLDGVNRNPKGIALGMWISTQRKAYKGVGNKHISKERIELLNQIGMIWDVYQNTWEKFYLLAKKYYEYYGNLEVPSVFKTLDGINRDPNGMALGMWINNQRIAYRVGIDRHITPEKIALLEKIGMRWYNNTNKLIYNIYYSIINIEDKQNSFEDNYNRFSNIIKENNLNINLLDLMILLKMDNTSKPTYCYNKYIDSIKDNNIDQAILYELLNNYYCSILDKHNILR